MWNRLLHASMIFCLLFLTGCGGHSKADMAKEIKEGIEKQSGVAIKNVELVKESSNKYTGYAETQTGKKINVVVTIDGDKMIWRTVAD